MELMALLRTPSTEIRRTLLDLVAGLVSERNVSDVMSFLKSEMVRCASDTDALAKEYREMLIRSIHALAVKYPEVADTVVLLLLDYLNSDSGVSILLLVKEMLLHHENLLHPVLTKLTQVFESLENEEVLLVALWTLAEFAPADMQKTCIDAILVPAPPSRHL